MFNEECFMEQLKFSSVDELFNRLKPAFNTKLNELKMHGLKHLDIKDMWLFLSKNKWSTQSNLELCDMVSDILNINEAELISFINQNK